MDLNTVPLVSVIIPFMNEERFLEETIQSVINQTYLNWELLLIDDGSTNKSTQIAKKYADLYPEKIYYFEHDNHENRGVSATRNLGVDKSNGDLIAFLDADDYFLPEKLAEQVKIFNKYPEIGMAAEASKYWVQWADESASDWTIQIGVQNDTVINPPYLIYKLYPLGKGAAPCPCSIMIKKEVIKKIGGFVLEFKNKYQLYEDQAFLTKVYLTQKIYFSSNANNLYRQRPDSVVYKTHNSGEYKTVRRYFLNWLKNYLVHQGNNDKKIVKLIDLALDPYNRPFHYILIKEFPKRIYNYMQNKLRFRRNKPSIIF